MMGFLWRSWDEISEIAFGTIAAWMALALIAFAFWGWPQWRVYNQKMRGQAALSEAEFTRKIAEFDAQAEIKRAEGAAQANKIIGESLHGNEGYLRYLWIQSLSSGKSEVIYIPTEAGLPILEARPREARQQ